MRYQILISGFGGQGVVFLVKVLSLCAAKKGYKFLGTENHGMSQRGGSVSSHVKIGNFYSPLIDYAQADLLIGLDKDEAKANLAFLKRGGSVVVNAKSLEVDDINVYAIDANKLSKEGLFDAKGLNVFMLGIVLCMVKDFPFSIEEIKDAIYEINPKFVENNYKILEKAIEYGSN